VINVSGSNAINGGYTNSNQTGTPSASAGGLELSNPSPTLNNQTIYWVNPGATGTVNYQYTLNNGAGPVSSSATFSIKGPSGTTLPQSSMLPNGTAVQIRLSNAVPTMTVTGTTTPSGGQAGIAFSAPANAPAGDPGSFLWVQLLNSTQSHVISATGPLACPATPQSGLDNVYPYPSTAATTTQDSPASQLSTSLGELQRSFSATMYLMWDPALPAGCIPASSVQNPNGSFTPTASGCSSIPVPLGSVTWGWSGCSINTLSPSSNGTNWNLSCGVGSPQASQSAGYPQWTQAVANGSTACSALNSN
jgi:hypothetical protein